MLPPPASKRTWAPVLLADLRGANKLGCAMWHPRRPHQTWPRDQPIRPGARPRPSLLQISHSPASSLTVSSTSIQTSVRLHGRRRRLAADVPERFDRSGKPRSRDPRKRFLDLKPKEKFAVYRRHVDAGRIFVGCEGESRTSPTRKKIGNNPGSTPATTRTKSITSTANTKSTNAGNPDITEAEKPPSCTATRGGFTNSSDPD